MKKFKVLQIGNQSWENFITIPSGISWEFVNSANIENFSQEKLEKVKEKNKKRKLLKKPLIKLTKYNCLIIDESNNLEQLKFLEKFVNEYNVIYNELIKVDESFEIFLLKKMAIPLNFSNKEDIVKLLSKSFSPGQQFGSRHGIADIDIRKSFNGSVSYEGNSYVVFNGDFGEDYQTILSWKYNIPIFKGSCPELWPEFIVEGQCSLKYILKIFYEGDSSENYVEQKEYSIDMLQDPIVVDSFNNNGTISISIVAKGSGKIKIGVLHSRVSRFGFGTIMAGGKRIVDKNRQELLYYFNPGDLKPPLNIYFSGYASAEHFEGYGMMRDLKSPYLLISDPRLEGGAFYLGSSELEKSLVSMVNDHLELLGFSNKDLILSGLSMGTFGATYYALDLKPHAIVVGKPLYSLGNMAKNEKIVRPNGFGTSLDLLKLNTGGLTPNNVEMLNKRFWDKFQLGGLLDTKIAISYMEQDDYDETAYYDILKNLYGSRTKVISKGILGRHNDNTTAIVEWFIMQYRNILKYDFGREE